MFNGNAAGKARVPAKFQSFALYFSICFIRTPFLGTCNIVSGDPDIGFMHLNKHSVLLWWLRGILCLPRPSLCNESGSSVSTGFPKTLRHLRHKKALILCNRTQASASSREATFFRSTHLPREGKLHWAERRDLFSRQAFKLNMEKCFQVWAWTLLCLAPSAHRIFLDCPGLQAVAGTVGSPREEAGLT